jgi:N-acetylglucosamine-6-sulfatase
MTSRIALNRRSFIAGAAATPLAGPAFGARKSRPNIVVIVVDDMRFDEYGAGGHPYLKTPSIDALGAGGATFRNAYHATPLCSPNRASILTGQYASRHGILDNTSRASASHQLHTFAQELQNAGYETAHVGKWHMGNDPTPRPGYAYWVSFAGQGRTHDPELYEDGKTHVVPGYVSDIFTDRAIAFATRKRSKPFMAYIGHKAIHPDIQQRDDGSVDVSAGQKFMPAPRHKGAYAGRIFPRAPSFGLTAEVRANQPVIAAAMDVKNSAEMMAQFGASVLDPRVSDETIQARAEMMLAVDEGVGRFVAALEEKKLFENTLFIFMSDNGYFFGEHGLSLERRLPYEESVKCPLVVSHPAAIAPGTLIDDFALSIDIAPTAVTAAGAPIPARMQGRALQPLLAGAASDWRTSFLVEYYSHDNPFPWTARLDYRAVREGRYKYVRWIRQDDAEELYDLTADPFERRNIAPETGKAGVLARMRDLTSKLALDSLGLPSANYQVSGAPPGGG